MADQPIPGAVIFAKDIAKVGKFYEAVLGLAVTHAEKDHIVLESAALQLVIHGIPKHIADTFEVATPPERRTETAIKPMFPVASLEEARTKAAQWGGELNPPGKEWLIRGLRVCDGHDPEGNVVQFRVSAS